jgi:flagellum-specific peptidoglycan hydrolase FlgJ
VVSLINEVAPVYATDPGYARKLGAVMLMQKVQAKLKLATS